MTYRHTQTGWTILLTLGVAAIADIALFTIIPGGIGVAAGAAGLVLLAVLGLLFGSLTVTVDAQSLRWHFGPGFWKKQVARSEIVSAEAIKTKWWWGYGIRITPHGWMYNVSGNQAVLVRLTSGKAVLVGSDEAPKLAAALAS